MQTRQLSGRDRIWLDLALLLTGSAVVGRLLTSENIEGWTGPLSAWAYSVSEPGPMTTLVFAGLLLLGFSFWVLGAASSGRMIRWPVWLALSVAVMCGCTIVAAVLAGQKVIAAHTAADWITQWLAFLMLLGLLRENAYRRVLLAAVLGASTVVSLKCIYQVYVEFPEVLAQYLQDPVKMLAGVGIVAGTPRAAQFTERISQGQATGYFAMGNETASVLILTSMAAIGLGADRLVSIRQRFSKFLGLLLLGLAGLMAYALVLTGSRGAIMSLTVALLLFLGYLVIRANVRQRLPELRLGRYYRTICVGVFVCIVLGMLLVLAAGLKFGSLGVKTLTCRWHYWVGSARMFSDWPWLGVGPGNFKFHYLAYKLPEAVEEVANPHNPIIQMFTETGIFGGLGLVGCLAGVFVLATRPSAAGKEATASGVGNLFCLRPLVWLVLLGVGAFILRTAVNVEGAALGRLLKGVGDSEGPAIVMLGLVAPMLIWIVGYLIGACDSEDLSGETWPDTPLLRVAVICGLAGFVLHNQIDFAILYSGSAGIFWLFAAMSVAMNPAGRIQDYQLSRLDRYVVGLAAGAAILMFVGTILIPVVRETRHLDSAKTLYRLGYESIPMDRFLGRGDPRAIDHELAQAAAAMPCDPWPYALAARVLAESGMLEEAIMRQRHAVKLSPCDWVGISQLADLLIQPEEIVTTYLQALHRYPTSPDLHESLADTYAKRGNWTAAEEHYRKALDFDAAKKLDPNFQWSGEHREKVQEALRAVEAKISKPNN